MSAAVTESLIESYARGVLRLREEYEFSTFWLGTRVFGAATAEEALGLKALINHRVGELVERLAPDLTATPEEPVMRAELRYPEGTVAVGRLQPLLVYGRYLKLSRDIPQSRWPCRRCRGRGCQSCGGTGRRYATSVEEIIAAPILVASQGSGTKFHAVGREDVDALMLGRGRPFILEVANPRIRTFDLTQMQEKINLRGDGMAQVREMRFADRSLFWQLARASPEKSYRALVICHAPVASAALEKLGSIRDLTIFQETPRRALHRRPNLVRRRIVRECAVELMDSGQTVRRFYLRIRAQAGTYVKEFISGDEGRTQPSVSEIFAVPCDCAELDVLEVHWDPPCAPDPSGAVA